MLSRVTPMSHRSMSSMRPTRQQCHPQSNRVSRYSTTKSTRPSSFGEMMGQIGRDLDQEIERKCFGKSSHNSNTLEPTDKQDVVFNVRLEGMNSHEFETFMCVIHSDEFKQLCKRHSENKV